MKGGPILDSTSYNRWCTHFSDVLSIFKLENYLTTEMIELKTRNTKDIPENHLIVHKQDKYIRIAISQLVSDVVFHLVNSSYTSEECWDNLRQFYRPNSAQDVDDLLLEFWSFVVEDDIEVDDFVQKLAEIRGRINLIDERSAPAESSMNKRILGHFIKCYGGFYMSTVASLRDSNVSFQSVVSSIRASHSIHEELHPTSVVALATKVRKSSSTPSPANVKTCVHCGRRGHLPEGCFLWLDTPDGSRWEAKNPKAAKKR
ncbi:hypothetical protein EV44_g3499 [Erysiphe necator]|uniref:CCHC-type domain-containing protein n=1 Tax=Uncinula necator TaxID=52586 RepID=A0A0B1P397_UNCNE|nr:hypothetical protein EV44_g3499 [Erysiphe necator]